MTSDTALPAELLPCPFCGGKPERAKNPLYDDMSMVKCRQCGAELFDRKWNTRALSATRTDLWEPIETAPKDGTDIILGAPAQEFQGQTVEPRSTIGHWTTDEECQVDIGDCGGECRCREYEYVDPSWVSWDGGFTAENPPTHWQPLPASPISTEGD